MSSTNTLTIRVCGCDSNGSLLSCNAEAYILSAGLSTGALIAILACIVILLGKVVIYSFFYNYLYLKVKFAFHSKVYKKVLVSYHVFL